MSYRRRQARASEILTISVITALFVLAGMGGMLWAAQGGVFRLSTPTPSATPRLVHTATPDFRATRTIEDMLTQVAFNYELATAVALGRPGAILPEDGTTVDDTVVQLPGISLPDGIQITPTEINVLLPVISQVDAVLATAIAASIASATPLETEIVDGAIIATPTPVQTDTEIQLPIVDQGAPATPVPDAPVVVETPTETPTAIVLLTDTPVPPTPTQTSTATPSETPTTVPTPTPTTPFTVGQLAGVVGERNAVVRVGPSTLYTQSTTMAAGANITMLNRDTSGEWIYFCCQPNSSNPGWTRSAYLRPLGNPTLAPPRETANANDARWLQPRPADAGLTPIPTTQSAAPADFPMARIDKNNRGYVAALPRLPLQNGWPVGGQAGLAGQVYTSGAVVMGSSVVAASADGHIYSFDRESGSQRWRYNLGENVRVTPLALGGVIYVLSESGKMTALEDQGLNASVRWQESYNAQPHGGIVAAGNRLLFTGRQPDAERLFIINPANGAVLEAVSLGTAPLQMPAAGGQLVYVVSDAVRAIDIFSGDVVWTAGEGTSYTAPPVYVSPGPNTIAELYVADNQGRVMVLDANTGATLWVASVGGTANSLAANDHVVVVAGNGFVRALARARRNEGQIIWQANVPGNVPGGVLVDDTGVLAITDSGAIQYFDAFSGAVSMASVQFGPLAGHAAVSGVWIFAPGQNGTLQAARAGAQ